MASQTDCNKPDAGIALCWFRQDLRLNDNPALIEACTHNAVLPIYILDDVHSGPHKMGAASRLWLHHSLDALNKSMGGKLACFSGDPATIIANLIDQFDIKAVYWNRCYEPWRITRDKAIKEALAGHNITTKSFNASLLWEPWTVSKDDGTPYKVFTPFYRKGCLANPPPRSPLPAPDNPNFITAQDQAPSIDALELLPQMHWDKMVIAHWNIGEIGAQDCLDSFLANGIENYKEGRNLPALPFTSRLSPHLHFGEISPHQIWHRVRMLEMDKNVDHFCSELGWREFSYSQLYHNPDLPQINLQSKFDAFPWISDADALKAWQKGMTGIPMVDAGMRELWQTGYMHNRVRMIVGSFLVKNLLLDWRLGEEWFWDTLFDADLANNSASWQWIAGCGADAAPYFRIFNPVMQGQKFDPEGRYVRKYIPELAHMPDKFLFSPWEAPELVLKEAGVILSKTYPIPIVNIKTSRERALAAFKALSEES